MTIGVKTPIRQLKDMKKYQMQLENNQKAHSAQTLLIIVHLNKDY